MARPSKRPVSPPDLDNADRKPSKRALSVVIPALTPPPSSTPNAHPSSQYRTESSNADQLHTGAKTETKPLFKPDTSAPSSGKKDKPATTKNDARPWSGAELVALHQHAIEHGAPKSEKGWEGVIPGRTGASARGAWRKRVLPGVQAFLLSLGN